jgi:hypothetical protein
MEDFINDFNTTDFFVIEIASKNSYKYKENYVHHILIEPKYGFNDIQNIVKTKQSDIEIEEDLMRIRELFYPKPFLVVCNIYTFTEGDRYDLIMLLKTLTKKMDINFLDPSDILSQHDPNQIYDLSENGLHHFTSIGHDLISQEYKKLITYYYDKYISEKDKLYTQIYYVDQERINLHTFHGLGDFIRGCMFLFEFCKTNGYIFKIDFSHHKLSNILYSKSYKTIEDSQNTAYAFYELTNIYKYKNVFTNMAPKGDITNEMKTFLIENILLPRIEFKNQLDILKQNLGIEDYTYEIVHIRTGDKFLVSKEENIIYNNYLIKLIMKTLSDNNININNIIFITDNKFIITPLKELNLKIGTDNKGHTGYIVSSKEIYDTMLEFFLMSTSKHIYQFSVYDWGSGFSQTINLLFNVPLTKYRIPLNL